MMEGAEKGKKRVTVRPRPGIEDRGLTGDTVWDVVCHWCLRLLFCSDEIPCTMSRKNGDLKIAQSTLHGMELNLTFRLLSDLVVVGMRVPSYQSRPSQKQVPLCFPADLSA